jgi:hypothetical protein
MVDFAALRARLDAQVFKRLSEPVTLDGVECAGMFHGPWQGPSLGQMDTGIVEPHLDLQDAAAREAKLGSRVEVGGKNYDVIAIRPDGTGLTTLILRVR